jgi:hypothetical protein
LPDTILFIRTFLESGSPFGDPGIILIIQQLDCLYLNTERLSTCELCPEDYGPLNPLCLFPAEYTTGCVSFQKPIIFRTLQIKRGCPAYRTAPCSFSRLARVRKPVPTARYGFLFFPGSRKGRS